MEETNKPKKTNNDLNFVENIDNPSIDQEQATENAQTDDIVTSEEQRKQLIENVQQIYRSTKTPEEQRDIIGKLMPLPKKGESKQEEQKRLQELFNKQNEILLEHKLAASLRSDYLKQLMADKDYSLQTSSVSDDDELSDLLVRDFKGVVQYAGKGSKDIQSARGDEMVKFTSLWKKMKRSDHADKFFAKPKAMVSTCAKYRDSYTMSYKEEERDYLLDKLFSGVKVNENAKQKLDGDTIMSCIGSILSTNILIPTLGVAEIEALNRNSVMATDAQHLSYGKVDLAGLSPKAKDEIHLKTPSYTVFSEARDGTVFGASYLKEYNPSHGSLSLGQNAVVGISSQENPVFAELMDCVVTPAEMAQLAKNAIEVLKSPRFQVYSDADKKKRNNIRAKLAEAERGVVLMGRRMSPEQKNIVQQSFDEESVKIEGKNKATIKSWIKYDKIGDQPGSKRARFKANRPQVEKLATERMKNLSELQTETLSSAFKKGTSNVAGGIKDKVLYAASGPISTYHGLAERGKDLDNLGHLYNIIEYKAKIHRNKVTGKADEIDNYVGTLVGLNPKECDRLRLYMLNAQMSRSSRALNIEQERFIGTDTLYRYMLEKRTTRQKTKYLEVENEARIAALAIDREAVDALGFEIAEGSHDADIKNLQQCYDILFSIGTQSDNVFAQTLDSIDVHSSTEYMRTVLIQNGKALNQFTDTVNNLEKSINSGRTTHVSLSG